MAGQAAIAQAAPRKSHVARGIAFAALGGICWGFSGTCAQLMTSELGVPVAWITCVRLLLGALIFLVACLFKNWRSLRGIVKHLKGISDEAISEFNLPTATPYVFEFGEGLNCVKDYFLGDPDEIARLMQAVADQGRA